MVVDGNNGVGPIVGAAARVNTCDELKRYYLRSNSTRDKLAIGLIELGLSKWSQHWQQ